MSTLTCIYPERYIYRDHCGRTPAQLNENTVLTYGPLVAMQEHLRDDHLHCSTDELQTRLRLTTRRVYFGDGGPRLAVRELGPNDPWQDMPYVKIEYLLPDGSAWLRSEPSEEQHKLWMAGAHQRAVAKLPLLEAERQELQARLAQIEQEIEQARRDVIVSHEERGEIAITNHLNGVTYWLPDELTDEGDETATKTRSFVN